MTNNPYIGPRTFSEAEAHLFFGREREARDLLSLVLAERLILFHAPSGAGKSSLMQTRLRPQLAKERFDVSLPVARVSGELPPDITAVSNIFTFNLILSLDQNRYPAHELTDLTLSDYLAKRVTPAANMPFVLIIDQFEEILTTNPQHWAQRQPFFEQLRQAMSNHEPLWVVLATREDYVAALDPYSHLLPNRLRTRYAMQRLSYQAALQAVSKPATAAGRPFAPGVAEQLVDNLRQIKVQAFGENKTVLGEFVEPVQLQIVCYQLWQALALMPGETITTSDMTQLGDVDKALADFYEDTIHNILLSPFNQRRIQGKIVSELQLRQWFSQHLITVSETRGLVYQNLQTGETAGIPNDLVKQLEDSFLLRAELRAGGTWLELVHDRFVKPILEANKVWQTGQVSKLQWLTAMVFFVLSIPILAIYFNNINTFAPATIQWTIMPELKDKTIGQVAWGGDGTAYVSAEDSEGRYYWAYQTSPTATWVIIPTLGYITNIVPDLQHPQVVYLISDHKSLRRSEDRGVVFEPLTISPPQYIAHLTLSPQGILYAILGQNEPQQLYMSDDNGKNWRASQSPLPKGFISFFAWFDGHLWLGTTEGLWQNTSDDKWELVSEKAQSIVAVTAANSNHIRWMGGASGAFQLSETREIVPIDATTNIQDMALMEENKTVLVTASAGNLYWAQPDSKTLGTLPLPPWSTEVTIYQMKTPPQNQPQIWLGTDKGLYIGDASEWLQDK